MCFLFWWNIPFTCTKKANFRAIPYERWLFWNIENFKWFQRYNCYNYMFSIKLKSSLLSFIWGVIQWFLKVFTVFFSLKKHDFYQFHHSKTWKLTKRQEIYEAMCYRLHAISSQNQRKTVIFWRNSVTNTFWIVKTSKFKKFDISNVNIIEWIFPDNIKK